MASANNFLIFRFFQEVIKMALVSMIHCSVCDKDSHEVVAAGMPMPTVCSGCQKINHDQHRAFNLAGLKALPVEERLSRIEAWIYDYKPVHVPAPRF
jgi:hypothetical protein